jgi:hypothetical protein
MRSTVPAAAARETAAGRAYLAGTAARATVKLTRRDRPAPATTYVRRMRSPQRTSRVGAASTAFG